MAKLITGINGPIEGKVGTVIGSSFRGVPYIKAAPGKKPAKRTPDEALNQSSFSSLHYWLQPIIPFLREGFRDYSETVFGFNAAKSFNLKHAFKGDRSNKALDPSLVQVSDGDLPLPSYASVEKSGNYTLQFTWDASTESFDAKRDQVMMLAYDDVKKIYRWVLLGQFRSAGTDTLELEATTGCNYHVYMAFVAHDRSRRSKSVYLGRVEV
jgi:hypothetical protein